MDLSTADGERHHGMFPLRLAFNSDDTLDWAFAYIGTQQQRMDRWKVFKSQVLDNMTSYLIPVIKLTKETPKEAVCTVFEKVNTGGVPLNVFELLTATFAGDRAYFDHHGEDFRLNDYWRDVQRRLEPHRVLRDLESTDLLQATTLLASLARRQGHTADPKTAPGVTCKRKDMLRLTLEEFLTWAPAVIEALEWCAAFLAAEHIFDARDVPYRSQLVPLAAIRAVLGDNASLHGVDKKLRQWYWCGVLGELYGGTTETRFARDLEQVVAWVKGGPAPSTVTEAQFHENRLMTLRTRNSAAYKGIYALLMREGSRDWMKNKALDMAVFFQHKVDIHHIFPKAWCAKNGIDDLERESIVNKTALSRETNIKIGGRAPDQYLPRIERAAALAADDLDNILRTHAIEPQHLRTSDFAAFFEDRWEALLVLVETSMDKPPVRNDETDDDINAYELDADEAEDDIELGDQA